jgi:hypothetical protein
MVYMRGSTCGLVGFMGVPTLYNLHEPLLTSIVVWLHIEIDSSPSLSIQTAIFGGSTQIYYHRICVEFQLHSTAGHFDRVSGILHVVDCHATGDSTRDLL